MCLGRILLDIYFVTMILLFTWQSTTLPKRGPNTLTGIFTLLMKACSRRRRRWHGYLPRTSLLISSPICWAQVLLSDWGTMCWDCHNLLSWVLFLFSLMMFIFLYTSVHIYPIFFTSVVHSTGSTAKGEVVVTREGYAPETCRSPHICPLPSRPGSGLTANTIFSFLPPTHWCHASLVAAPATAQRQFEVPRHCVKLPSSVDGAPTAFSWTSAGVPLSIWLARHIAIACRVEQWGSHSFFPDTLCRPIVHLTCTAYSRCMRGGITRARQAILALWPIGGGTAIQDRCPVNHLFIACYSLHTTNKPRCARKKWKERGRPEE
jgi:hypothetical protein